MRGGDDCLHAELEEIADGSPAVEFWGYRDDVSCILATADVFVLPSLTEIFIFGSLEAMLQGVTTIVSDAEGFRDFVEDGVNGLVFPKGDTSALAHAIERVLAEPDFRDRIAAGGKRTVRERFSSERMVDDIDRLYQNVLKR